MKWHMVSLLSLVTLCTAWASATQTSEGSTRIKQDTALADEGTQEKPKKIMCSWLAYDVRDFICGDPPMSDVKKRCDKKATEVRGEKTECECTDDQDFIRNMCD